jgi:hypothetical protein
VNWLSFFTELKRFGSSAPDESENHDFFNRQISGKAKP